MQTPNTPLQLTGICTAIGSASRGETWQKQEFIIQTEGQYPTNVCFTIWNDKLEMLNRCQVNDKIKEKLKPSSTEHQCKWYTELNAWKVEVDFTHLRKEATK